CRGVGVVRAAKDFGLTPFDRCNDGRTFFGHDVVNLAPQSVGCYLELVHPVATESIGIRKQFLDALGATCRKRAEIPGVSVQESLCFVEDLRLLTVEEGLDGVDQVLLGFEQLIGPVEVVVVSVDLFANDIDEKSDNIGELTCERVPAAAHKGS